MSVVTRRQHLLGPRKATTKSTRDSMGSSLQALAKMSML